MCVQMYALLTKQNKTNGDGEYCYDRNETVSVNEFHFIVVSSQQLRLRLNIFINFDLDSFIRYSNITEYGSNGDQ